MSDGGSDPDGHQWPRSGVVNVGVIVVAELERHRVDAEVRYRHGQRIDGRSVSASKWMRWLTYDPSADLDSPEQKAVTATAAEGMWRPAQMRKFLDHLAVHRFGGCFALTRLGLRREEVGKHRRSDIELETGALRIRQARVDVNRRAT